MTEFDRFSFSCFGVVHQVKHDNTFALSQVHALNLDRREQTLKHQRNNFESIVVWSASKSVHDKEGRILQFFTEELGVSFVLLLKLDNILRQRVVLNLESYSRSFRVLY